MPPCTRKDRKMNNSHLAYENCFSIETAKHRADLLTNETGVAYTYEEISDGIFRAVPVAGGAEFLTGEKIPPEVRNKPKTNDSYNGSLDDEPLQYEDWQFELNKHIEDFNNQYAVVLNGTKTLVMKTSIDDNRNRKRRDYLTFQAFNGLYSNTKIKVGEKTDKKGKLVDIFKSKSQAWLDNPNRAQYIDGIIFKPATYINGKEKKPRIHGNKLNLWEGYSVEPKQGESGALERIYYHIKHVICSDDEACAEYLLNWVARCLQYPEQTGQVAVALKGLKGCGKGTLGNFLKAIFGQHGMQVTNPKHLTGNFNAHLADCCFLFADEVFFAGDKVIENIMKNLITEPNLMVEAKGIDAIEMTNRLKIFMASNNDWIAPVSRDERRYFVLDVSS